MKLYVDTIQKVIEENDKSRSYLSSSPTNGAKTIEEGYIAENPYSALFGDSTFDLHLKYLLFNQVLIFHFCSSLLQLFIRFMG